MDERDPKPRPEPGSQGKGPNCAVNSTFNYSVGAVSVAAGAALAWAAWRYFAG
jgi:hypothetical protein